MHTLVIQSYRTTDVAPWIRRCLDSTRAWAAARGFDYEFVDDRLFGFAPAWVRERCGSQILPVTDVARLYLLRERLEQGWQRVIWVDADVLVFAPERFVLDDAMPYALCRELWLAERSGQIETVECVNNAVIMMSQRLPLLDFWIFAAEEILRTHPPGPVDKLLVGTRLLTDIANAMPLRVLNSIGLFSPPVVRDLAQGGGAASRAWARQFAHPIGAANLCASLQDHQSGGARVGAEELESAVDALLATRGSIINDVRAPAFAATIA
jgi:hypothetical protein